MTSSTPPWFVIVFLCIIAIAFVATVVAIIASASRLKLKPHASANEPDEQGLPLGYSADVTDPMTTPSAMETPTHHTPIDAPHPGHTNDSAGTGHGSTHH